MIESASTCMSLSINRRGETMRSLSLLFIGMVHTVNSCQPSEDEGSGLPPARLHSFSTAYLPVSLGELQEKFNVTWYRTTNPIQCARLTARQSDCCKPFGFLYDSASTSCQPIPWRDGVELDLQNLSPGNSSVYRFQYDPCKTGFDAYQYYMGNATVTACLYINYDRRYLYNSASKVCKDLGGYIASAKTLEKFALLLELSQGMRTQDFWVGLNDITTEGVFVWDEDGTVISPEMKKLLFKPGEPSNGYKEDCAAVLAPDSKLSDNKCTSRSLRIKHFCEVKPGC